MPTYLYECAAGAEFEVTQKMTDAKLTDCPLCGVCAPKRLISGAPAFNLVPGPAGSWGAGGYSKTPQQRSYEHKTGLKTTRRAE